jgi:hypothetical protein
VFTKRAEEEGVELYKKASRVARWFIFKPKKLFGYILEGR